MPNTTMITVYNRGRAAIAVKAMQAHGQGMVKTSPPSMEIMLAPGEANSFWLGSEQDLVIMEKPS